MATGQFPKRRETDEEAKEREEELRLRNLKQGYDKDGKLLNEELKQVPMYEHVRAL